MYESALAVIKDVLETDYFPPAGNWPECFFQERAMERWALKELYSRVKAHPETNPLDIMYVFVDQLTDLHYKNDNQFDAYLPYAIDAIIDTAYELL